MRAQAAESDDHLIKQVRLASLARTITGPPTNRASMNSALGLAGD
jgi:hypothetical protein